MTFSAKWSDGTFVKPGTFLKDLDGFTWTYFKADNDTIYTYWDIAGRFSPRRDFAEYQADDISPGEHGTMGIWDDDQERWSVEPSPIVP